ncbi:MAG: efflux RND transporter periplasmic adaptor subunit [Gammaproteobacteria bacterium]|nr:efflux RND transporter periplasmic adaptor subunit [Gammaproteobacteria bacterium]
MKLKALGLVGCLLFLSGCESDDSAVSQVPPPVGVGVYEIALVDTQREWRVIGRTESADSVNVVARVEGEVTRVLFDRGAQVSRGDVLFEIEDDDYRAQVDRARSQVAARRSALTLAEKNLARGLELAPRGYLSAADLDQLRSAAEQAEAGLTEAQAALQQSLINLEHTQILAPISGRARDTAITAGNMVGPASGTLVEIIALNDVRVQFQLTDSEFITLSRAWSAGNDLSNVNVYLLIDGERRYAHTGVIDFVDTAIQRSTGTVVATARFPNPEEQLVPGLFVTLLFEQAGATPRLLVPEQAVQQNQLGPFVMVVGSDNTITQRQITLGLKSGPGWEVADGLSEGEQVLVEGFQKLRPGATVAPSAYVRDPATGLLAPEENAPQ